MDKLFVLFIIALTTAATTRAATTRAATTRAATTPAVINPAATTPASTTTTAAGSTTTTESPEVRQCQTTCPTTPEYNPVCGSNNVTYDNLGRLICAQYCGVNVVVLRSGARCSTTTN